MTVPLSQRLRLCASMVPPGARVADIGTDHGYLGIYLLTQGIASRVAACDLREGPLSSARRHAARYGVSDRMECILSDGLHALAPGSVDTVVCAGMGGELIATILGAAPWLRDPRCTLILQPQNSADELRQWLAENGYGEEAAGLARDGSFLYCASRVRYGVPMALTPAQRFVSPALLASGSELLGEYLYRTRTKLERILHGMQRAEVDRDPARRNDLTEALAGIREMEATYGTRS